MVDHADDRAEDEDAGQAAKPGGERVAKALARAGVASRREVERLIADGRVAVNGRVLDTPAVKVGDGDILTVDGVPVAAREPTRLFRYHKPAGLITTNNDPQGRPDVFASLPEGMPRVISVGRLDLNTEGLLLLTNDGELARALELPSSGWIRRYRARCHGVVAEGALEALKDGVTIDGVRYGAIEARVDKAAESRGGSNVWISVAIAEGKNREVRRVLEHLNLQVNRLIRIAYGPFQLGDLGVGGVAEVGPRVIREQLGEHMAPEAQASSGKLFTYAPEGGRRPAAAGKREDAGAERPRRAAGSDRAPPRAPRPPKGAGWAKAAPRTPRAGDDRRPPKRDDRAGADERRLPRPERGAPAERPSGGYGRRPSAAAPAAERSGGGYGRRPTGEAAERPARRDDRPERPRRERPDKPRADQPYHARGDRPEKPRGDRPDRPRGDRPERARPDRTDRPRTARFDPPRGDRPDRPRGDRPDRAPRPPAGETRPRGPRPPAGAPRPSDGPKRPGGGGKPRGPRPPR